MRTVILIVLIISIFSLLISHNFLYKIILRTDNTLEEASMAIDYQNKTIITLLTIIKEQQNRINQISYLSVANLLKINYLLYRTTGHRTPIRIK